MTDECFLSFLDPELPVETMGHDSSSGSVWSLTESEMAEDLGDPVVRVGLRAGWESGVGSVEVLDDASEGSSDFSVVGETRCNVSLVRGDFYEGHNGVCQNNDRSYYLGYGKP